MSQAKGQTLPPAGRRQHGFAWAVLALLAVLLLLFHQSLDPSQILFSSDGPLGANAAAYAAMPDAITGMWQDLNWVGNNVGSAFPSLTYLLLWVLKPLGFARFYAPITLLVLGMSMWLLLRRLGFRAGACAVGALAAALNSDFFSYACWGLGTLPLAVAGTALCLAALAGPRNSRSWLRAALAGIPLGMAVMEGFDSGAILSLYVAAFVLFQSAFVPEKDGAAPAFKRGVVRLLIVAVMAGFTAYQAISVLLNTQLKGVAGMQQDARTRMQRWSEATQWSLPKSEALRIVIPGLYGYRMDTPGGGVYWGGVGRDPAWDDYFDGPNPDPAKRPEGRLLRHSGAGFYAGVLVVMLALWAVVQSAHGGQVPFSSGERRFIAFWAVAAVVSLLLAFGRHAPFYQMVYALPYFSTIRNPIKFLHPFSLAVVVLAGYGVEGLCRLCEVQTKQTVTSFFELVRRWWRTDGDPHRRWVVGCSLAVVAAFFSWLRYAARKSELIAHLQQTGFPDTATASAIAGHSVAEVGVFFLVLAAFAAWFTLVLAGVFSGTRTRWAAVGTGLLIALDLARANTPWVVYWNRHEKYATNPVFDLLRQRAHEHRVAIFPFPVNAQMGELHQVYLADWIQHGFRYYNIQSSDVVQEPRVAIENLLFRRTFYGAGAAGHVRMWELTNTRFLLGLAGSFADLLNQQFDPDRRRFRLHTAFDLAQRTVGGQISVLTNSAGPFALIEFSGALPRATLYSDWQVVTNDEAALQTLVSPGFDPHRMVLVGGPEPSLPPSSPSSNTPAAGSVDYVQYTPKDFVLRVRTDQRQVLLVNDKYDPNWSVTVDGQPARLMRCNHLMRGVLVPQGEHMVRFQFRISVFPLCVSVATLLAGLGLIMFFCHANARRRDKVIG